MDTEREAQLARELGDTELARRLMSARRDLLEPVPAEHARRHLAAAATVTGAVLAASAATSATAAAATATAGISLAAKVAALATAVTLTTTGGLAAAGALPEPAQVVADDLASRIGLARSLDSQDAIPVPPTVTAPSEAPPWSAPADPAVDPADPAVDPADGRRPERGQEQNQGRNSEGAPVPPAHAPGQNTERTPDTQRQPTPAPGQNTDRTPDTQPQPTPSPRDDRAGRDEESATPTSPTAEISSPDTSSAVTPGTAETAPEVSTPGPASGRQRDRAGR